MDEEDYISRSSGLRKASFLSALHYRMLILHSINLLSDLVEAKITIIYTYPSISAP